MADIPDLLINGRFLTRPSTGVDRAATELVRALARYRAGDEAPTFRIDVAIPRTEISDDEIRSHLGLGADSRILRSRARGYLWEQAVLARLLPKAVLLSLCNIGPVFRRNQLALIHDAQVFDVPQSYSRAFRLAYRTLLPRLARRARWLATVSRHSRSRLLANGIGSAGKIAVIPNGADHVERIAGVENAAGKFGLKKGGYFLVVGSLAPHKNLAVLGKALTLRRERSLPLAVVGTPDPRIFGSAVEHRPDNGIEFLGRVSDEELKGLYRHARALLFPSFSEGFGLPALEAMACGCPVVASDAGALPETCAGAALFCSPDRPDEWAWAMDALTGDDGQLASLSAAGARRAAEFSWTASARKLIEVLQQDAKAPRT